MTKKQKYPAILLLAINPVVYANEIRNFDYHEFTYGVSVDSIENSHSFNYKYSKSFSDSFYYSYEVASSTFSGSSNEMFVDNLYDFEIGLGVYKQIFNSSDIYLELLYSRTKLKSSDFGKYDYDSFWLASGAVLDLTSKFDLNVEARISNYGQAGFELSGLFDVNQGKNKLVAGLNPKKGFPFVGVRFR